MRHRLLSLVAASLAAACAHSDPGTHGARVAPSSASSVAAGDCSEALRRAAEKPDLDVDRIPAPRTMKPPLRPTALRKDGSADLKVDVLIDTLGRADMKTFHVVLASDPALVRNAKEALPRWRFTPALLGGCKVPRVFHLMASVPPRSGG